MAAKIDQTAESIRSCHPKKAGVENDCGPPIVFPRGRVASGPCLLAMELASSALTQSLPESSPTRRVQRDPPPPPTEGQTFEDPRTVSKILIIGGGITYFTNAAPTFNFKGILRALEEVKSGLITHIVKVYYFAVGQTTRKFCALEGIPPKVYSPGTRITDTASRATYAENARRRAPRSTCMKHRGAAIGTPARAPNPTIRSYLRVRLIARAELHAERRDDFRGHHIQKLYWGTEETLLLVYTSVGHAVATHPGADVVVLFASSRSVNSSSFDMGISDVFEEDIGGVVGQLWFKHGLPACATKFETFLMLRVTTDHGPAVSGYDPVFFFVNPTPLLRWDLVHPVQGKILSRSPRGYRSRATPPHAARASSSTSRESRVAKKLISGIGHKIEGVNNSDLRVIRAQAPPEPQSPQR
ncbi:hypothetical protein B0H12DRAFT_1234658 [Mycena haematopus]|nr:hypothetical protein B0H12DRAFT_1234658 [Mycena haematopus]